jgi:hypothetical protein
LTQTFDLSALEAAWQAADKASAIYETPFAQLDKLTAAALGPAGGVRAVADMTAQLDKLTAALGPAIRQLMRRDEAFALYKQVLDTVRTPQGIGPLLAEGSGQPTFTSTSAFADAADAEGSSPATDEKSVAQAVVGAWIAWERRYNPELLLLVSVLILFATVVLIVIALSSQTALAPSQPDPAVTSLRHSSVNGGSQKPSGNEPQSESSSPSSRPADGPARQLLPGDDKDLCPSR